MGHDGADTADETDDVGAWLVRARPQPSDAFVAATERQLLGRAARPTRGRLVTVFAGAGLAGAVAAVALVAVSVGGNPLAGGDDDARAVPDCPTTTVRTVTEPQGALVQRDGRPQVVTVPQRTVRDVTRCR